MAQISASREVVIYGKILMVGEDDLSSWAGQFGFDLGMAMEHFMSNNNIALAGILAKYFMEPVKHGMGSGQGSDLTDVREGFDTTLYDA
ncbi:MAG: hypothetical protein WAV40_01855 [Microgenomates group bacterium]